MKRKEIIDFSTGFAIDFKLGADLQRAIVQDTCENGEIFDDFDSGSVKIWQMRSIRELDPVKCFPAARKLIEEAYIEKRTKKVEPRDLGFYVKFHPGIGWRWTDCPSTKIIRKHCKPLLSLFTHLSQVDVLLLRAGHSIPIHRDFVPGNVYGGLKNPYTSEPGTKTLKFLGEQWFAPFRKYMVAGHAEQDYMTLRIPLSLSPKDQGRPWLLNKNFEKRHYSAGGRAFMLNDTVFHGADAVSHPRGVLMLNGVLNMKKVSALKKYRLRVVEL